ncbi:MAG: DUF1295 domain-containing protein [Bacteroidales bacterium]
MIGIAVIVFIALNFVDAGYGMLYTPKWGKAINNRLAWFLMEFPIFTAMIVLWACSPHRFEIVPLVFLIIFEVHYLQRSFIFPWLIKGKNKMPLGIMFLGISFNLLNAMMQGYWIFFEAYNVKTDPYPISWLWSPQFIIGLVIFIWGFYVNLRSDYIIRHLRKSDEDTKHYLPKGGMFKYVTSANYFGELMEWLGFAIFTWSVSGLVFFIWTFANLVPRARTLYKKYQKEFPEEMKERKLKRVFPFIY